MYFSYSRKLRRNLCLAALVVVLALAVALWLRSPIDDVLDSQQGIVRAISWQGDTLRLEGAAPAGSTVTATLDDTALNVTANDAGVFTVEAKKEQRIPARLQIMVAGTVYDFLITRLQKRFVVLQRPMGALSWQPVVGFVAPQLAGIAAVQKTDDAYGITLYLPASANAHTVYVYGGGQLVHTAIQPQNFVMVVMKPADSIRVDVYDEKAVLVQRARLLLPPEGGLRYTLNDGTVWLFTDFAAQKAEADELIPGQFIPVAKAEDR